LTRNESDRIEDTIHHIYPYVDEIIINDGSDDGLTVQKIDELKTYKEKIKYFKTEKHQILQKNVIKCKY